MILNRQFSIFVFFSATLFQLVALCTVSSAIGEEAFQAKMDLEVLRSRFGDHCFDCHGDGSDEGDFSLDDLAAGKYGAKSLNRWEAVWKNIQSQTMPPADAEQPKLEERKEWSAWIQSNVFQLDPNRIDPGKVVLRRLNRAEYQETIRQLTEVKFDANAEFPADDTGYGFDTIGDVLHVSPVLMEKYLAAADSIVNQIVPRGGPTPPEKRLWSRDFHANSLDGPVQEQLKFDAKRSLHTQQQLKHPGRYEIELKWNLQNAWANTNQLAEARLFWHKDDGTTKELDKTEIGFLKRTEGFLRGEASVGEKPLHISVEFKPTANDPQPTLADYEDQVPYTFGIYSVDLIGPTDDLNLVEYPTGRYILVGGPPSPDADEEKLDEMTAECVRQFGLRAFRRPVDETTVERLVAIARDVRKLSGKRYEDGIAEIARLILASPRFLFRVEEPMSAEQRAGIPPEFESSPLGEPIDDFSLATRLSYLLWGGPPDHHLLQVAQAGELRPRLEEQIDRMIEDEWRLRRGVSNFVGQWLLTRDVHTIPIQIEHVVGKAAAENIKFDWNLREAMKEETESLFRHLIEENRPAHELLNADYTFVNEPLAKFYGIEGVQGYQTQKVTPAKELHRGGLLKHASMLMVTSNPTRTSPVKRGLFLMENVLGTPVATAPPDVPPLEDSKKGDLDASLREILKVHRDNALCASCHERMDPLGLALENYDAIGLFREREFGRKDDSEEKIDPSGKLMTGEKFSSVDELADILANQRRGDFHRCLTEKMLVYALGRGLTYRDATTVDRIVEQLKADDGRMRTLILAIVRSVPFTHLPKVE